MRKQRLYVDFEFDFEIFGIVSTFKDYKLAWHINKSLHTHLAKEEDIIIKFVDSELVVSHYKFGTESSEIQLLRNRSYELSGGENQYLIPELSQLDYFVLVNGQIGGFDSEQIIDKLKSIQGIDFVMKIEVESLKSRENFIF